MNMLAGTPSLCSGISRLPTPTLRSQTRPQSVRIVAIPLPNQVFLIPESGTGPDNAHGTDKNIPDLRQFIQAGSADKVPDAGDILLRIAEKMGGSVMGSGHFHTPEFVKSKELLVDAKALLREDDRAGIVKPNGKRYQKENRRKHNKPDKGEDKVDPSLGISRIKALVFHASTHLPTSRNRPCSLETELPAQRTRIKHIELNMSKIILS